jgi:tripartite-type tricarboxylate transporter receptor subunit TctC
MGKTMMKTKRVRFSRLIFFLGFWAFFSGTFFCGVSFTAPVDFPKKEITIVVPFGPGGAIDILARGIANTMKKYLGVPFVVNNIPGAGGSRGRAFIYHSAPDGYTWGGGTYAYIVEEILEKQDYESKKFTYLGNAQCSPDFVWVKSDSPIRSVKDFKTFGKRIQCGTFGLFSPTVVPIMIMADREKWPMVILGGYKGGGDVALGLVRGDFDFAAFALSTAAPFVRSGQIRPIMRYDLKRDPRFPDAYSMQDEGFPDLAVFTNNYWFMGPPGVPKDRLKIVEDGFMKTLKDPEFIKWAEGAGIDISPISGEELTKMVFNLFDLLGRYKEVIKKYTVSK